MLMNKELESMFVNTFGLLQKKVHKINIDHGFWTPPASTEDGTKLALIHAEVSECLEAIRDDDPPDKHVPSMKSAVVELADVVIRCMDLSERHGWPLSEAILKKAQVNMGRPHKHGGKKF